LKTTGGLLSKELQPFYIMGTHVPFFFTIKSLIMLETILVKLMVILTGVLLITNNVLLGMYLMGIGDITVEHVVLTTIMGVGTGIVTRIMQL